MYLSGLSFLLLLSFALGDCTSELLAVIGHFMTLAPTDTPSAMAAASGKWVNDLGNYSACSRIPEAEYALLSMNEGGPFIGIGLCGPKTCSVADYYEFLGKLQSLRSHPFSSLFASLSEAALAYNAPQSIETQTKLAIPKVSIVFPRTLEPSGLTFGAGMMIFCCSILVLCVIAGTLLEALYTPTPSTSRKPQKDSIELMEMKESLTSSHQSIPVSPEIATERSLLIRCLTSFSLISTLPRLFSVSAKAQADPLFILNALRVLSILWIVLGHTMTFGIRKAVSKNPQDILPYLTQMHTTFILSAHYAVDTGFLLAYLLLQKTTASEKAPGLGLIYVHRIVRILPTFAFTLFLFWTLGPYSAQGPMAFGIGSAYKDCDDYWWTNLFFINNEYPDWKGNLCFIQTWYLATDMQLYLIAVPIVLLYHRKRIHGWYGVLAMTLIAVVSSAYLTWEYDFGMSPLTPGNFTNNAFAKYYVKWYTRGAPLALGLCTAFLLHSARQYKSASQVYDAFALRSVSLLELRSMRNICLITAVGLGLFIIMIQNDALQGADEGIQSWTKGENTLFIGTYRFLWGVSLSLFFLPLLLGLFPLCRWVLSWSIWAPLARLSFCVYLIHVNVILSYNSSAETARWFGNLAMYADFCFVALVSFAISVVVYVCVEMPAQSLVRVLLKVA